MASSSQPPFVGRQRELEFLRGQLPTALEGKGCLILIGGEAGIGKSRLAEEFGRYAAEKGFRTLVGRCVPGAAAPPTFPFKTHSRNTSK